MIELIINDKKITVANGKTILDAARENDIYIPHLCWDRRLTPFGGCRICVVQIEGHERLFTSCSTPAENGMVVHTESPDVLKARQMVMDLLLVHHPLDCPVCDKAGVCKLQDLAYQYGPAESKFQGEKKQVVGDLVNPLIDINPNRCILCGRCVRVCWEHQGVGAINFIGRGFTTTVSPPFEESLNCEFCGQCVDACPVGALGSKNFKHRSRAWFLERRENICPYCSVGCTLSLEILEGKILNVRGLDFKGVNEGDLCTKGRYGYDYIYGDSRLRTPLIKKDGQFKEATWEEAVALIAKNIRLVLAESGPEAIGAIGSPRCTNEDNYMLQKFMRTVVGSDNIDSSSRFGYTKVQMAFERTFGISYNPVDMNAPLKNDVTLVLESDITSTHPIWGLKFIEAVRKGKKLIVADPRETKLSNNASTWVRIKPGTSQALLYGLIKRAYDDGFHLKNEMTQGIEGFSDLVETVSSFTVEKVCEITGMERDDFLKISDDYLGAESRLIAMTIGAGENSKSVNTAISAANLVMFLGDGPASLQIPPLLANTLGMLKMGVSPYYLPGFKKITGKPGKDLFKMLYEKGAIKFLYVMGENLIVTYPDTNKIKEALSSLDFMVVQDIQFSETAQLADVVLPASSWSEKDGTYVNFMGLDQKVRKVVAQTGESMPDWQILRNLARYLHKTVGADSLYAYQDEISAIKVETETQKWRFVSVPFKFVAETDNDYPLYMVTGNLMQHSGALSSMSKSLSHVVSDAFIQVNQIDAIRYHLKDDAQAHVDSRNGQTVVKVRITDEIPQGMVFAPIHFSKAMVNALTFETNEDAPPLTPVRVRPVG
ncbi:MAG: molybdopterin-dependent oxidoreductase [Nitrospirae bacterium]|nr:molybdopterin-dependent oxidoreductase [Nitrospirota bacterium]MBF0536361.1 molybdopterin-dependent oxidoreductase [Nitrospirota bacterium]MBF0616592.1 molybdopterin-dependent oxidoreductase [Nitrospirota bacterium]